MRSGIEILWLLVAFVVFILIAVFFRERRLGKHKGLSREEFINEFTNLGIPTNISEAVYRHYTASVFFKKIRIAPDDSLGQLLQKGEEDIDDDARLLLKKLNLEPPPEPARIQWTEQMLVARRKQRDTLSPSTEAASSMQPIQTLRDMVLWLDWVRQHQAVSTGTS